MHFHCFSRPKPFHRIPLSFFVSKTSAHNSFLFIQSCGIIVIEGRNLCPPSDYLPYIFIFPHCLIFLYSSYLPRIYILLSAITIAGNCALFFSNFRKLERLFFAHSPQSKHERKRNKRAWPYFFPTSTFEFKYPLWLPISTKKVHVNKVNIGRRLYTTVRRDGFAFEIE